MFPERAGAMAENSKAIVSLRRCRDYDPEAVAAAVAGLLEPLGGMGRFVLAGQSVLLKPNLIVPRPAEAAITTHPEVVRAVARQVIASGGKPFVADSPAFGSAKSVARACGLEAVAEELGLEIRDLSANPRTRPICGGGRFKRAAFGAAALDADVVINLPKIKTHAQMVMTLGLKNLFGAVAGKRKPLFHFLNGGDRARFGRMLVAVTRALAPALTIEDGIVALERYGPTRGDPRRVEMLVASADVTAADRVALEVLGVDPREVPCLEAARELGYGRASLDEIEVVGEAIDALRVRDYVQVQELVPIHFTLPHVARSVARQAWRLAKAKLRPA